MTGQTQETKSQFDAQADKAALALRRQVQDRGAQIADSGAVLVGPDGKPPPPPPPEGSYARMAMDQAAAQAQRDMGQPTQEQVLGDQPPAGTTEQSVDGSVAPPLTPPGQTPQGTPGDALSENAQRRIGELVSKLREKDQALELLQHEVAQGQQKADGATGELEALRAQYQQMVDSNLDQLDPDTRAQVMNDARMRDMMGKFEQSILSKLEPRISGIAENQRADEMLALSGKYPAFDLQIHGHLIEAVRAKNPNLSVEQAFLAATVDTPEERQTREAAAAFAVPPVLPPGNGAAPKYIPEPAPAQSDPEGELRTDAARIAVLRRSSDPLEQKAGMDLAFKNIGERLFGK